MLFLEDWMDRMTLIPLELLVYKVKDGWQTTTQSRFDQTKRDPPLICRHKLPPPLPIACLSEPGKRGEAAGSNLVHGSIRMVYSLEIPPDAPIYLNLAHSR